jgi:glucosamine-6-phosphate deaminase
VDVRVVGPDRLDDVGAGIVSGWLAESRSSPTLVAALGTSALGLYAGLGERRTAGGFDTSTVRLVQLDEYVGIPDDDPRSLFGWLVRDVATPLGVPRERILRIDGMARDPDAEADRVARAIDAAGGIDVAVLGLGPNGHLGFNEPPSRADAPTRTLDLSPASIDSNARYWGTRDRVPRRAITLGMDLLLAARRTLLVVSGESKRAILRTLLDGSPRDDLPASHLRTAAHATVLADTDAWPPDIDVPNEPTR